MIFEWDEAKRAANLAKHGVDFADAARLEWGAAKTFADRRRDYGEARTAALVPLGGRLHACLYTLRDGRLRIISLRKANARERRTYEQLSPPSDR
ncbi:MAG: BrnT family toxin [Pseudomonadota bacterium]